MPLTDQEKLLLARARQWIASGRLPNAVPRTIFGGFGTGASCSLCEALIQPGHVEYELGGDVRWRFHLRCHAIWQLAASEEMS